jgi:hypothetical protein
MMAAKRVLRYVKGTSSYGIWYSSSSSLKLEGYSDSDWASCVDDRRSTLGHVFNLGSGAITWSSKKQDSVALSSSEAEYMALSMASCQAIWLRRLLKDVLVDQSDATTIWCDNLGAISMGKNPTHHNRTKHIAIRYHFVRSLVGEGEVKLGYCNTNDQVADVLTKGLSRDKHAYFRLKMGVCDYESRRSVEVDSSLSQDH